MQTSFHAPQPDSALGWAPKFLCHSFKSPIILSDGAITSCTLDRLGRNRVGSIFDDDFDTFIQRYGEQRLRAMAEPLSKPLCHACYTRLPRWRAQQVPRSGWFNEHISEEKKLAYRQLYDTEKLSLNIELSSACNLRCTGCSLADPTFRFSRGAPNIDLDRLMAWLDGHVQRISHVRLYHMGETWLHPRWFEFCRFLKQQHPAITLFTSTNGMPLASEKQLSDVVDSGIDHVMFSIHGATEASTQAFMGKPFHIAAALAAARRLVELRRERKSPLYLSWKYLLFEWNDSATELALAQRLMDEVGFDELHYSITSQPAPSKRYAMNGPAWAALRAACAAAWPRAAAYQETAPMTAVVAGQSRRSLPICWDDGSAAEGLAAEGLATAMPAALAAPVAAPAPAPAPAAMLVLPTEAGELARQGRALLDRGCVLEAARVLAEGVQRLRKPSAALHKALGDALLAAGRAAEAVAAFDEALRLDPTPRNEQAHLGLARGLQASGRLAEAEAAYEAALRLREAGTPGLYGEDVYLELRDISRALGHGAAADNAWRLWKESAWLADPQSRTVYCPIAKNACTYLKTALVLNSRQAEAFRASGQDGHVYTRTRVNGLRLGEMRLLADPRYFSFILLRDPFERLASAYGYNFVRPLKWRDVPDAPGRVVVNAVHLREGREPDWRESVSFDQFVRHIVTQPNARLDHHWRPQSAFFDDLSDFSHVGIVEQMEETQAVLSTQRRWTFDFDAAPLRNALPRASLTTAPYDQMRPRELAALPGFPTANQLFSDRLRELVSTRYGEDLRLYQQVHQQMNTALLQP